MKATEQRGGEIHREYERYAQSFRKQDMEPMMFEHWIAAREASEAAGQLHHVAGDHGHVQR